MTSYVPAKEFEGELWVRVADFQKAISEAEGRSIAKSEQQEPVAWLPPDPPPECSTDAEKTAFAFGWFKALEAQRLSTSPPKREWQGLTDEEAKAVNFPKPGVCYVYPSDWEEVGLPFVRAIEAKLKEKNTWRFI